MALVIANIGEAILLAAALGHTPAAAPFFLRLYDNAIEPAAALEAADLDESAAPGYDAIELLAGSWVLTPGAPTVALYPQQTFMFTGPGTSIRGYYVTDADGALLWAEALDAPFAIEFSGDNIKITPRITFGSVDGD